MRLDHGAFTPSARRQSKVYGHTFDPFRRAEVSIPEMFWTFLPQLNPAFDRHIDWRLLLFGVREACALHFLGSSTEAFAAYVI